MTTEQGAPEAGAWKIVPMEPDEEMVEAHFAAHAKAKTVFAEVSDVWAAMLAASPSPPPVGVGADWRPENAFITCCAAKPDYYVRFDFRTLKEAQEFHRFVVTPPAAPPVGGEVVKLHWVAHGTKWLRAKGIACTYEIRNDDRVEERKAEAQSKYDALVRSALVPSPLMKEAEEALRKAAEPFIAYASLPGFERLPADTPITAGSQIAARQLTAGDLRSLIEALAKLGVSP